VTKYVYAVKNSLVSDKKMENVLIFSYLLTIFFAVFYILTRHRMKRWFRVRKQIAEVKMSNFSLTYIHGCL